MSQCTNEDAAINQAGHLDVAGFGISFLYCYSVFSHLSAVSMECSYKENHLDGTGGRNMNRDKEKGKKILSLNCIPFVPNFLKRINKTPIIGSTDE